MLNVTCTNEEKVPVTAAPKTASGRPTKFDGPMTITVQSGDGTVEQDAADPNTFTVVSGDAPGDTVYLVEADADLGAGVLTLQETVTLTVTGVNATNFGLTVGAAVPK